MPINQDSLNALLMKVVGDIGGAMSAVHVLVGDRLGIYKALAKGPCSSAELAQRTGLHERMLREWLLNQAAGGYVTHDPAGGRFSLTDEQAAAFADDQGPAFMNGAFDIITSVHRDADKLQRAFKDGKGFSWADHDACLFCGTERFFAASYRANLMDSWIPSLEGVRARIDAGGQVADVGCGHGSSTMLMARAFPASRFIGFDFHPPSVECAAERAAKAGLSNVRFEVADASTFPAPAGGYDLVACFDCLHDMGDPVACARRVKQALAPTGTWMIVEPAAGDTVSDNLNPVGRVFSAASAAICVPASLAYGGPALGACAGEKKLREVIAAGGFARVRRSAETPFNMVLEARP
jgi:2-polyprenyl-3-methyl-5-hydroxy-6-metoxy-1,4-benzoquinol methylase